MSVATLESRLETLITVPVPPGGHAARKAAIDDVRRKLEALKALR